MNNFCKHLGYFAIIALFACLMGFVGWLYLAISSSLLVFLWAGSHEEVGQGILYTSPFLILLFTTAGAYLFALLQEKHGQYPVKPKFYINDFISKKRIEYKYFYKAFFFAMIPLILGASVGPEASLVGIFFLFYTMSKDLDGYLEKKLDITLIKNKKKTFKENFFNNALYALKIIVIYAVTIATLTALSKGDPFPAFYVRLDNIVLTSKELLLLLPFFIIGYCYAVGYLKLQSIVEKLMDKFKSNKVRVTFTGFCIGLTAIFFPLTILSGEMYAHVVIDELLGFGVLTLFVLAFVKVVISHISVAGHIKGGPIYPIIYSVYLFAAAIALLFGTDYVFTLLAILSVVLVKVFKNLIAIFLFLLFFFPIKILLIVFIIIFIIIKVYEKISNRNDNILEEYDDELL